MSAAENLYEKHPPHNKDAEIAVLGGLLIEPEALAKVIEILKPPSFYFPAHTIIYEQVLKLYEKGQPVDILSLSHALNTQDLLERVGGASYLMMLTSSIPTTANIQYYAKIVDRAYLLRRIIQTGTEIVEMAYQAEETDIGTLLNLAEQKIFEIGQRRLGKKLEHIGPTLWNLFAKLEGIYTHPEQLQEQHMSTGLIDLNSILGGGFSPSDLIILAARPSMGKTSLAINIGLHMAIEYKRPVAVFSLEMSEDQLATRMLCSEATMNSRALRSGTLHTDEWEKLSVVIGRLASSPFYIDDTSQTMPAEIRSKARRLKAQHNDLGLIIVDYLQLMDSGSGENRAQELSKISRSMKHLARELNVPVIALSQLNRAVEQRQNKRPMLSDLRECVVGSTPVLLANGQRIPIQELVGTTPEVLAVNEQGKVIRALSDKVWSVDQRPILKVHLASGRALKATPEHRILTFSGWKHLRELEPGSRVALARQLPEPEGVMIWPDEWVALLGQMIGDGSYLKGAPMRYTSASEANFQAVEAGVKSLGGQIKRYKGKGAWSQILISGNGNRWKPLGVNRWFRELGIFGQRSHEKRIPQQAFQLEQRQTALLLKHLWATDGSIFVRTHGRGSHRIFFASNSQGLVEDIAVLLLRFGIVARLRQVLTNKSKQPHYTLDISSAEQQLKFLSCIGGFGPRQSAAQRLADILEQTKPNPNLDTLPQDVFEQVKQIMNGSGISQRAMATLRGTAYGGTSHFQFSPSRKVVLGYAEKLKSSDLKQHATNDLFWDRIVSIESIGQAEVFDLTVPGPESWLSDGIVSHNSGAIEQDADIVLFLYRDEYYNQDSKDKNIAEVIVAKHRNGPTGTVRLYFDSAYTRFGNLSLDG